MRPPERITEKHSVESFDCGNVVLNEWLMRRAIRNEISHDSRTYVVCDDNRVVGYYSIATGGMDHAQAPSSLRRNAANPIPVMILGRLAVDIHWQERGLGKDLLRDAILKTVEASQIAGIKALIAHAISPQAKNFYLKNDFLLTPIEMTLIMPLKDILNSV